MITSVDNKENKVSKIVKVEIEDELPEDEVVKCS